MTATSARNHANRTIDTSRGPAFAAVFETAAGCSHEIENQRCLPTDLVEAMCSAKLFRLFTPSVYGGLQVPLIDGLEVFSEAARHDGSTGWCLMIANTTALLAGSLDPSAAETIFGDPQAITGGFAAPAGTARASDDSLVVSGRWSWGSGTSHCTWIGGGTLLVDADGEMIIQNGRPQTRFVMMPSCEVELFDTWHVAGLKGTRSGDYAVSDCVIPIDYCVSLIDRPVVIDDPLYRFSSFGALALGVSSVMLGLAQRAIDEFIATAERVPTLAPSRLAERSDAQRDLARAHIALRSMHALQADVVGECWERLESGAEQPTLDDRRALRQTANACAETSVRIVTDCFRHGGGQAVFDSHPLQRVLRDVHVAQQHAMVAAQVWEPLGQMLFGQPTDARLL